MTKSSNKKPAFLASGWAFLNKQQKDWKVTVIRTSMDRLSYQMVFPYLSIYIVALGASATQLGMVNSIGMIIAGIFGPFTGSLIDRYGPKKIYLFGIAFLSVSYLTYSVAQTWTLSIVAMIAYWLGYSTSIHSCASVCGNCLVNRDRATGMMICESVGAGLLGMLGPVLATWIVAFLGGVSISSIRPLFFAGLIITLGSFVIVLTQLSSRKWSNPGSISSNPVKDGFKILQGRPHLVRWLVVGAATSLPLGMIFPFSQVFAHQFKEANEFVLGAMITGSALASIVFAIPAGRIADKVGRKKVLFVIIPLFWLSNLMLIWAPLQALVILAGTLQGFFYIGGPIIAAMERELVPAEEMGRWIGLNRLFKMLISAVMALAAGFIWDKIGPQYLFVFFVILDAAIRMPLLISMPETLHGRLDGNGALLARAHP